MSQKFFKHGEVPFYYHAMPILYPGIKHPTRRDTQLTILDDYGKMYLAAYRNGDTCKVGIHFLLKKDVKNGKSGFWFKDKFYKHTRYGWVW